MKDYLLEHVYIHRELAIVVVFIHFGKFLGKGLYLMMNELKKISFNKS